MLDSFLRDRVSESHLHQMNMIVVYNKISAQIFNLSSYFTDKMGFIRLHGYRCTPNPWLARDTLTSVKYTACGYICRWYIDSLHYLSLIYRQFTLFVADISKVYIICRWYIDSLHYFLLTLRVFLHLYKNARRN